MTNTTLQECISIKQVSTNQPIWMELCTLPINSENFKWVSSCKCIHKTNIHNKTRQRGFGSADKTWTLCLTHLNLSIAASRSPLVGIHTGWPMGFNLNALLGSWRNLANPYFLFTQKKKYTTKHMHKSTLWCIFHRGISSNRWTATEKHVKNCSK